METYLDPPTPSIFASVDIPSSGTDEDVEARKAFREKITSINTGLKKGGTKTWDVHRDSDGKVIGTQTEHWNDRVDGTVTAPMVVRKTVQEEKRD